ncbi:metalloprotease family protein [Halopiger goleimassiliensis]|uniref:metalloprotease family protein n=1 Tax=Halopiger goleimassiliensis TaxID=1293048 RepID=UPI001E2FD77B|nr:metalloprotease family protein [Halopiger goleimassiliensis]
MLPESLSDPVVLAVVGLVLVAVTVGLLLRIGAQLVALPGVVVHEFAHAVVCRLLGVTIHEVAYFRLGDPPGYVRHEEPARYRQAFAIGVAPFLVNTIVAFAAFLGLAWLFPTVDDVRAASPEAAAVGLLLAWIGLSVGSYAFPSTGDAKSLWKQARTRWRRSPLVLLGVPVVLLIVAVNLLSRLWADLLYAIALGLAAFVLVTGELPIGVEELPLLAGALPVG